MSQRGDEIVIEQSFASVTVIYGFVAAAFAAALFFGHRGAETDAGRLTIDILFGGGTLVCIAVWIAFVRKPGRLIITPQTITYTHRGAKNPIVLRNEGVLYIHRVIAGASGGSRTYLKVEGSDEAIASVTFDWRKVRDGARSLGWQVRDP